MTFQFQCPQGHLLEGDEAQAGQTINCPVCGMLFIIPQPISAPVAAAPAPAPQPETPAEPELLHIPCPNGHELEAPPDMLDMEVLCPQCNAQFQLRAKDSIEHRRRREEEERIREAKSNKFFLNFAIGVAVVVVLLLLTLIILSAVSSYSPETKPQKKKAKPKAPVEKVEEPTDEAPMPDASSTKNTEEPS